MNKIFSTWPRLIPAMAILFLTAALVSCSSGGGGKKDGPSACEENPSGPECLEFCRENPTSPTCSIIDPECPSGSVDCDGDGLTNGCDTLPNDATVAVPTADCDADGDGYVDDACTGFDDNGDFILSSEELANRILCDNCPVVPNPDQLDADGDLQGNACQRCPSVANDRDGDCLADVAGTDNCVCPESVVGCTPYYNPGQDDFDTDGMGNACDPDIDGDGANEGGDPPDNCPLLSNPDQADSDDDGTGDACEDDRDGDGILDAEDACPALAPIPAIRSDYAVEDTDMTCLHPGEDTGRACRHGETGQYHFDRWNGCCFNTDGDAGDTVCDHEETQGCVTTSNTTSDIDCDGTPNNTDPDRDGDGLANSGDICPTNDEDDWWIINVTKEAKLTSAGCLSGQRGVRFYLNGSLLTRMTIEPDNGDAGDDPQVTVLTDSGGWLCTSDYGMFNNQITEDIQEFLCQIYPVWFLPIPLFCPFQHIATNQSIVLDFDLAGNYQPPFVAPDDLDECEPELAVVSSGTILRRTVCWVAQRDADDDGWGTSCDQNDQNAAVH